MIEYKLRRARTSRIRFSVRSGAVKVVAPVTLPFRLIDFYVQKNARRINEYLAKENFKSKKYENGDSFDLLGEKYKVVRTKVCDEIAISGDKVLIPQNAKLLHIKYFYAKKLNEVISKIVFKLGLDLGSRRIIIKLYESKWGSCSPKSLSFNLKLVLAPLDVVKYVVVHEFSHIQQPNHSRLFWKHIESLMDDFKKHRKWLRDNGNGLTI